jgi:signal transduction histidine kinase
MGSRGRSIRLRIYFLVAIPLITMLGLFSYVAYASVTNWLNLDRAPNLVNATAVPMTKFVSLLQAERRAAVVYLSHSNTANLSAYQTAITTTKAGEQAIELAINSPGTESSENAQESAAISKMTHDIGGLGGLRAAVSSDQLTAFDAFGAYTKIITDQDVVFQAEANSIADATSAMQGLGLIATVNAREDLDEQDAMLAGALAARSLAPADRVVFDQAVGRQQDDTLLYAALFSPAELKIFNAPLSTQTLTMLQGHLTTVQQAVEGGATLRQMELSGLSPASWQQLTGTIASANFQGGIDASNAVLARDRGLATDAKKRVWETAAIGLAGLILTLLVTITLARSINRRLTVLRRSALTLAEEQLPAVVARLRRGESVDVAAEAPPLRVGGDEIGQVGQAIDTVRQTALRSAVEEARLRQGINDVFRNLARRNQSLLQRQLTVLDGMERKATDPDVLEDLFKMDHLTTRMRRHAEGLIILSGAAPGRSWSAPVKLIDVMRGAVAEVEDYARVAVSTQSKAALSGSAVTDVIHMLAELIENATTLSPPFTQVRVSGEIVGNGFAIEIEDRGLGMTPQRMAELNERLANPPDINPANTEQLGLFVVGQLARRHGIGIALRPSPYGGVTAVALVPRRLIVEEGPAAITAGGPGTAAATGAPAGAGGAAFGWPDAAYGSDGAYGSAEYPGSYRSFDRAGSPGFGGAPGYGGSYPAGDGGSFGTGFGTDRGYAAAYGSDGGYGDSYEAYGGNGGTEYQEQPFPGVTPPAPTGPAMAPAGGWPPPASPPDLDTLPVGPDPYSGAGRDGASGAPRSAIRISGAVQQSAMRGDESDGASGPRRGRHSASEVPVVTDVPVSRPDTSPSFDVFTPRNRPEGDGAAAPGGPGEAAYAEAAYAEASYAGAYTDYGAEGQGNNPGADGGYEGGNLDGEGGGDYKGLPRRVRQANLAPQLRSSAAAAGSNGSTGVPRATAASLSDMRNTLSAMQRGWQQGRAQSQPDPEGGANGD